jgi:DNA-binding MarR family transcriptional regulator
MNIYDAAVLEAIKHLNDERKPFGIRALVKVCGLADRTISKAIRRLEAAGHIRVVRAGPGLRHEYVVNDDTIQEVKYFS